MRLMITVQSYRKYNVATNLFILLPFFVWFFTALQKFHINLYIFFNISAMIKDFYWLACLNVNLCLQYSQANFLTGDHAYVWLASVLTGAYGFPMLYRFYNIYDQLRDDESKGFLIPKTTLQVMCDMFFLFCSCCSFLDSREWLDLRNKQATE